MEQPYLKNTLDCYFQEPKNDLFLQISVSFKTEPIICFKVISQITDVKISLMPSYAT